MYKNKIAIICSRSKDSLLLQDELLNRGSNFKNSLESVDPSIKVVLLEKVNGKFEIELSSIDFFYDKVELKNSTEDLKKEYNLVSFNYFKEQSFSNDMNVYDQDFLEIKYNEEFLEFIISSLQKDPSSLCEKKLYGDEFSIQDLIEKNDNDKVLALLWTKSIESSIDYKLSEVKKLNFEINFKELNFNEEKAPKSFKLSEEIKEVIEIEENSFSMDIG